MTTVRSSPAGTRDARRAACAPPARRIGPHALLALIAGGAAGVLALWWVNTPPASGPGALIAGAGRITGLLAGYGCAVLLLLMARVPALDRGVGTDRLARWHAFGGRYVVGLAVAHTLLAIWGYSVNTRTGLASGAATVVLDQPDMLKATVATVLLVGVGGISARTVRRRLPYEAWQLLHLATYLAIFLGFFHVLSNGDEFVGNRPARLAWYALYLVTAALLVWYRLITPVRRGLRHRLRVLGVRPEAPGVVSVYLTGAHLEELRAEPGQFFRWRFWAPGLWWTASPYSLSAPPSPHRLRITVKDVGGHSGALARLRPGTRVWAEGPYGGFTAGRRPRRKALLVAGGVGITPLRTLFETLPGDAVLLYLARRPEDLALRAELEEIAGRRPGRVHCFVDEPAAHSCPLTTCALRRLVPDVADRDVYLCGPPGMMQAVIRALRRAGVRRRHIHYESFEF
ncbi:ferric reductase-like transmembrane domain-containing protein [Thermomonospora sp. CIF 1]|uniref:ferredoxin reductase family protein n=1 Tax=Thermomonospora sp. CIF 1 TaxID=1916083 RepID=UPI000ACDA7FE|nr:ferric reductase-like transmembrane domain-containing protein [Thermomonospora sp. CIF 1]PKK15028.1 MAG: ferric reductase [Thermomonospora sp. CIF 1]